MLMRDISDVLLSGDQISTQQIDLILRGMVQLHDADPPANVSWCDVSRRLTLLTPGSAAIAASYGAPVAKDIREGWQLFERLASQPAVALIYRLFENPKPLVDALSRERAGFLHGDLKVDNIALGPDGALRLIDWAMTLVAPPAVELGWFLAINSRRMTMPLDDVMHSYAGHAGLSGAERHRHDSLTVLCGLLLRGWRKALDAAAGEPAELRWWCERVNEAEALLR
jgi:aminoglycoside phosphotransferase (APT) family kinase protein